MTATRTISTTIATLGLAALSACGAGSGQGSAKLTSSASTGGNPAAVQLVPDEFSTIAQGITSGITVAENDLIVDPITFDRIWNRHTSFSSPSPRFDFHRYGIVAAFSGEKNIRGCTAEVVRTAHEAAAGHVHATVREFSPGSWKRRIAQPTEPYHMVSVPRPATGAQLKVHKQQLLDFQVIHQGSQSLIGAQNPGYTGDLLVIRDFADYNNFWWSHTTDPMPAVNFTDEMVVAVLAGYIPRFGNTVETKRLLHDDTSDEVRIDYVVNPYRGGAAPPQTTETPFQILRVQRTTGSIREEIRSTLPPTDLGSGDNAVHQGGFEVQLVRDQQSFDGVLQSQVTGGAGGFPIPRIDWGKENVVFAFLGVQPSTAIPVSVAKVDMLEDGELEIVVHTQAPIGRPFATPTSPFHIVSIPKTYGPFSAKLVDVTPRP